jgi:hypothetical protein
VCFLEASHVFLYPTLVCQEQSCCIASKSFLAMCTREGPEMKGIPLFLSLFPGQFTSFTQPLSLPGVVGATLPWPEVLWVPQAELPSLAVPLPPSMTTHKMEELSPVLFPTFDTFHQGGIFLLPALRKTSYSNFRFFKRCRTTPY